LPGIAAADKVHGLGLMGCRQGSRNTHSKGCGHAISWFEHGGRRDRHAAQCFLYRQQASRCAAALRAFRSGQAACPATDSRLAALIAEHDDLDVAISVLLEAGKRDDLLITRLKKRKLQIKDEMKKRQCAIIDAKAAYGLEYSDQGSDFTPRAQRPL
jgi:hypothetical protein